MRDPELTRLNARRIDAANALRDADAQMRGPLARWADPSDADPSLSARITEAQRERDAAQAAYDEADHDLDAEITAQAREYEDAQAGAAP